MKASRLTLAVCAAATLAACDRSRNAVPGGADDAAIASSGDRDDPCTLVTQAEAERYLGPLAHAPFRADEPGDPSPEGRKCKYLGADGRYIYLEVDPTGGKIGMSAISMGGQLAGQIFTDDNGKTDTLEGAWDEARWLGPGHFFAVKGDAMVTADVSAAKGGIAAAADLSSKALERVGHPFAYDGAKAAAGAPRQRETGDACALLTAADIEGIVGPLEGAPVPSGHGPETGCRYRVRTESRPADLKLDVSWRHGFEHFAGQKMVTATVMGQTAGMPQAHGRTGEGVKREGPTTPSVAEDSGMQKIMGALQSLARTQGIQMNPTGGLVHDTVVAGPWAEGAILGGVAFVAVKNDVQVSMGFEALSIEQAKALMAKVMGRL